MIRKYLAGFIGNLKMAIAYRGEMLLWGIIDTTPLLGMLILWFSVIPENSSLAGYTQQHVLQYYFIGFIFRQLTGSHFEDFALEQIRKGTFSFYLLKPVSLKIFLPVNELAWRFMGLFTSILPVLIVVILFAPQLFPSLSLTKIIFGLVFITLAYILECLYSLYIVSMGFIFENAKSFMHLRWILSSLFSGILIPFEFMPPFLQTLSSLLPFKYRFFLPINFFLDKISVNNVLISLAYGVVWVVCLAFFLGVLWNRCIKTYSAAGQ